MADAFTVLENLDKEDAGDSFRMLEMLDQQEPAGEPAQAQSGGWWDMSPAQWKRQSLLTGRAAAKGVAALPLMAMDTGVALRNFGTNLVRGITPTLADFNPFAKEGGSPMEYELPSSMFESALDEYLPRPETRTEKVANFVESVVAGAKIPAPQAAQQAPVGFVRPSASPTEQILREAHEAGYVVPPTTAKPSLVNKMAEGFAGKITTAQSASAKNQEITNELVRKTLGFQKGQPITADALQGLRETAGKVYAQIADSGEIVADARYLDDLAQLGRGVDEVAQSFPGANVGAQKQVGELVDSLLQEKFSSKAALQYLRELRKQASTNLSGLNAADPQKQALGMAQREAASTLEDLILRHLEATGKADIAQSFDKARRVIAVTHSVEDALNEATGNVIAGKLGQQFAKGKPLSKNLELAAQFSRAFPKASKEITESMPGVSPLDWMVSIGSAMAAQHAAPMAGIFARPAMRQALLAPWWQQGLTDAVPYAPQQAIGIAPSAALQAAQQ
jgi:hypothetical protein